MAKIGERIRVLTLLLLCADAQMVSAQIRRCTAPDGTTVFTDRRCVDVGGVEQPSTPSAPATNSGLYRGGCSRTLRDLVLELTNAIDAQDVNRLAGVYDWQGMSNGSGYALMDRLQILARRPLADVSPVYAGGESGIDDYYPQTAARRAPVGLRLEQTLGKSATPAPTVLYLRRYLDCWWVRL